MKKKELKSWVKDVVLWGWGRLLGFNFFTRKIQVIKNESVNKNCKLVKINQQVEMSIHSTEAQAFSPEIEDWIKEIQQDSQQRFLLGNFLNSLVCEVEKNAAVIQCTVEQGGEKKRQHLLALYPSLHQNASHQSANI